VDSSYSDEQQAAIALARRINSDRCTQKPLRVLEISGGARFDRALRDELAEAGLLAAGAPPENGRDELDLLVVPGICEQR